MLDAAEANGLDPFDIAAVGYVESGWHCFDDSVPVAPGEKPKPLIGLAGEVGCMQVTPGAAADAAKAIGLTHYDLADPSTNIAIGGAYLRLLRNSEGSMDRALAVYNGGPDAPERKPVSARTYVSRVRAAQGMKGQ